MNCEKCGKQISDGTKFCTYCGARQTPPQQNGVPDYGRAPQQEYARTDYTYAPQQTENQYNPPYAQQTENQYNPPYAQQTENQYYPPYAQQADVRSDYSYSPPPNVPLPGVPQPKKKKGKTGIIIGGAVAAAVVIIAAIAIIASLAKSPIVKLAGAIESMATSDDAYHVDAKIVVPYYDAYINDASIEIDAAGNIRTAADKGTVNIADFSLKISDVYDSKRISDFCFTYQANGDITAISYEDPSSDKYYIYNEYYSDGEYTDYDDDFLIIGDCIDAAFAVLTGSADDFDSAAKNIESYFDGDLKFANDFSDNIGTFIETFLSDEFAESVLGIKKDGSAYTLDIDSAKLVETFVDTVGDSIIFEEDSLKEIVAKADYNFYNAVDVNVGNIRVTFELSGSTIDSITAEIKNDFLDADISITPSDSEVTVDHEAIKSVIDAAR